MCDCRWLRTVILIALLTSPIYGDAGSKAYKEGLKDEQKGNYDEAYNCYREAHTLVPGDPKYFAAYTKARFTASSQHVRTGQLLLNTGALRDALAEFQRAVDIDTSSFIAQQELRRTADLISRQARQRSAPAPPPVAHNVLDQLEPPLELKPLSNAPVSMYMTATADVVYKTIGKLAGFNVLIDPDYKPQKITIDLNNVSLRDALDMVRLESKTFWRPVLPNTIFVSADSAAKRKDLEQNVVKTFYLRNIETPNELQEAANVVRQMLDVTRVQLLQAQDALILRGTPDQMLLAEKLLADFDKPKSEVVVDVTVMEVSRDKLRNLGTTLPTSFTIAAVPPNTAVVPINASSSGSSSSGSGNGSGGSSGTSGSFTINSIKTLNGNNFIVSVPSATFTLLSSDSNSKILQNPELRVLNNEKATLRIGDRVPIATGSFQPGLVGGGAVSPLINTQFQYLDVGVNIDITPHIHANGEVTLKLALEISSVTGSSNIGGITQPIIGQRRIEHETRLTDGEVNLLGGILEDTETQSMSGYPWVSKIPILKYLFAQENRERQNNEIVFAITPHIVRAQEVNEDDTLTIEVGTANSIEVRRKSAPATAPAAKTDQQADPPKSDPPSQQSPTPNPPSAAVAEPKPGDRPKQ